MMFHLKQIEKMMKHYEYQDFKTNRKNDETL